MEAIQNSIKKTIFACP